MEKRYQVFVSSTYADLKEERRHVIQALMELDCIPAGMELFPAADEEQLTFIKRIIDDCDYYLVIVGGRYGSTTPEGVSYTEKEYDYAMEKGLKVIAFLRENLHDIPVGKSDIDPELRARLTAFRDKLSSSRLVRFWTKPEELPGLVALSLSKTIKVSPAVGWVRANTVANEELLSELNELRKENDLLRAKISDIEQKPITKIEGLAGLDEQFTIHGTYWSDYGQRQWKSTLSWKETFAYIAPYLVKYPNEEYIKILLKNAIVEREKASGSSHEISDQDFQTVAVQFRALGLINTKYSQTTTGGMALFWSLTAIGERLMIQLRTIKSAK